MAKFSFFWFLKVALYFLLVSLLGVSLKVWLYGWKSDTIHPTFGVSQGLTADAKTFLWLLFFLCLDLILLSIFLAFNKKRKASFGIGTNDDSPDN